MRPQNRLLGVVLLSVCITSTAVLACGDKIVPLGGGVQFERLNRSRNPSTIFLMPSTGPSERSTRIESELVDSLRLAGHSVRKLDTLATLGDALRESPPDMLLVESGLPAPTALLRALPLSDRTVVMAVVTESDPLSKASAQDMGSCVQIADGTSARRAVRQIERVLQQRSKAGGLVCPRKSTVVALRG